MDVLILNTAVVDFRSHEFSFLEPLVEPGGMIIGRTEDMPDFRPEQYQHWINSGAATAGGPGNCAPLMSRAGLRVGVGVLLGSGPCQGWDAQGQLFQKVMTCHGVDTSCCTIHPNLPTGTTFIYDQGEGERGRIGYYPNANNDFDFGYYGDVVRRLDPSIVYYMYSGLSERGDANGGEDLAAFIRDCQNQGRITLVDSHTLTGRPQQQIAAGQSLTGYHLLIPLLPTLDLFFTSYDEARLMEKTILTASPTSTADPATWIQTFLEKLTKQYWDVSSRSRLWGVTVNDGVFYCYRDAQGQVSDPRKVTSRFLYGDVIDLVGAGDSFRAGLLTYIAKHRDAFQQGHIHSEQAMQMGCLFASLFIKAPLTDRYSHIGAYEKMLAVIAHQPTISNYQILLETIL